MREDLTVRVGGNIVGLNTALSRATKQAQAFKGRIIKLGLGLAGVLGPATWLGTNFEKNIKFATQVATRDVNNLGKNLEAFTKVAREMGKTTEYTAVQSAEALKFLGLAGLEASEAVQALPATINLATAGMISLGEAADISTNIMKQYELEVSDLNRVNDVLAKVQSTANTNIIQAAEAFIYGGTTAHRMGMSIEETAAIIGLLANRGVRASLAGTTLRQSMLKLLNPSKEAAEILERYKISLEGVREGGRSFIEILKQLADANLTNQETAKLLGARASQLSAIFSEGSEGIQKYVDALEDSKGVSDRLAASIRDTLWGSFKALLSAIQEVGLALFDKYKDPLKEAIDATVEYVRALGTWIDANGKLLRQQFGEFILGIKDKMISIVEFIQSHKEILEFGAIGWFFLGKKGFLLGAAVGSVLDEIKDKFYPQTIEEHVARKRQKLVEEIKKYQDEIDQLRQGRYPGIKGIQLGRITPGIEKGIAEREMRIKKLRKQLQLSVLTDYREFLEEQNRIQDNELAMQVDTYRRAHEEKKKIFADAYLKELEDQKKQNKKLTKAERERLEEVAKSNLEAEAELNQKIYQDRIAWLSAAREVEKEIEEERLKDAEEAAKKRAKEAKKYIEKQSKIFEDELDKQKKVFDNAANSISNAFGNAFSQIVTGTKKVSEAFYDMAENIVQALLKIVLQQTVVEPLSKFLTSSFSNIGGGIFAGGAANTPYIPALHSGGVVGVTRPTEFRRVDPTIFRNAPRLHDGLKSDEYPAILQTGERVMPRGYSMSAPEIEINITNETNQPVQARQEGPPKFDGRKWVYQMVMENLDKSQSFRMAIRGA